MPARRHYILPARIAHESHHAFVGDNLPKLFDPRRIRLFVGQLTWIPRNQIDLGAKIGQQLYNAPSVIRRIVESAKQDVFERQPLPRPQWIFAARAEKFFQRIFAIDRHDPIALLVG